MAYMTGFSDVMMSDRGILVSLKSRLWASVVRSFFPAVDHRCIVHVHKSTTKTTFTDFLADKCTTHTRFRNKILQDFVTISHGCFSTKYKMSDSQSLVPKCDFVTNGYLLILPALWCTARVTQGCLMLSSGWTHDSRTNTYQRCQWTGQCNNPGMYSIF